MTPCEEKGYKAGDEFVALDGCAVFKRGAAIKLTKDDGTNYPEFTSIDGSLSHDGLNWAYADIETVALLRRSKAITRTNGQPFATESSARQQLTAKGLQGTHEVVSHEGGYALVPKQADAERAAEQPTMTANPITTLIQARQARDEAEKAYQEALGEAREYLGEGFELTEVVTDGPLVDGEDMADPANWREGDVLIAERDKLDIREGNFYSVRADSDGDLGIVDDVGDRRYSFCGLRFHHRPA